MTTIKIGLDPPKPEAADTQPGVAPPLYRGHVFEPESELPCGRAQAACAEVVAAAQQDAARAALLAQQHGVLLAVASAQHADRFDQALARGAPMASVDLPRGQRSATAIGALGAECLLITRAGRQEAILAAADTTVEISAGPIPFALEDAGIGTVTLRSEPVGVPIAIADALEARLLFHAAFVYGVLRAFLREGLGYLRNHARAWREAPSAVASEDPLTLERVGGYVARAHALELLVARAAAAADSAKAGPSRDADSIQITTHAESAYRYAGRVAPELANGLIEVLGASSTDRRHELDRPWRELQTYRALDRPLSATQAGETHG